jgi:hypothetical protein
VSACEHETRAGARFCDASSLDAIPATLADSLMARLDRLGPAKEVAQIASVCGREHSLVLERVRTGELHLFGSVAAQAAPHA